jgi:L-rhamnonate dehydratase
VPGCNSDACDSAQDDMVVKGRTDEGITGMGVVDTNPWIAKKLIEAPSPTSWGCTWRKC